MDQASASADLPPPDRGAWSHIAGSFFAHLALLTTSALLVGPLGELSLDSEREAPRYLPFPSIVAASADPDEPEHRVITLAPADPDEEEPAESRCGELRGGSMGDPAAPAAALRYGVQGPSDNPDPHVGRMAHIRETSYMPMILPALAESADGDPHAPTAPWGRDDSLGTDARSARGQMWGEEMGMALGSPGAGMGLSRLCEACGANGRGASLQGTAPGGPTSTELSFLASLTGRADSRLAGPRPRGSAR